MLLELSAQTAPCLTNGFIIFQLNGPTAEETTKKRIRIIYVHLFGAICTNLMDICKTGASCLDLKLEICLEDKNTAVQHWWDVNGVVTAAGLERGQWDVRAAGGQGTVGDARHPWGLLHSQTDSEAQCKYLDLPAKLLCIWSLRALKRKLVSSLFEWHGESRGNRSWNVLHKYACYH